MRRLSLLLGSLLLVSSPLPVRADADSEVSRLAAESHRLYQDGKYREAAQTLLKAYEAKPIPTLLFNVARCLDKAGDVSESIRYYQRFLDSPQGNDPAALRMTKQTAQALDRLRQVESQQKQDALAADAKKEQERMAAEERARVAEAETKAAKASAQREKEAAAEARQANPAPAAEARSKVPGIALIGLGVAGIGTGAVFGVLASSAANETQSTFDPTTKPELRSTARTRAVIADVAYGVGGAAAVVGTILLIRSLGSDAPPPATTAGVREVGPMWLPGGVGIAFGGAL